MDFITETYDSLKRMNIRQMIGQVLQLGESFVAEPGVSAEAKAVP